MFKKVSILAVALMCFVANPLVAQSQVEEQTTQNEQETQEELFTQFSGKLKTRVFADYGHGLFNNNSVTNFNIKRAVLGYTAEFGKGFSADLEIDFASTEDDTGVDEYATYVRNAELIWEHQNLKINFGVITPKIFNYIERFWGYRYIVKSPMDQYSFGPSRDLGVSVVYNVGDWLSLDATMLNGDGYKFFETDNNQKYSLGATFEPTDYLSFRAYGEVYDDNNAVIDGENQSVVSAFAGYKQNGLAIGLEYDYLWNRGFIEDRDEEIFSVFAHYKISKMYNVFARYDKIESKDNWDGSQEAYYLGMEYNPVKYVKLAPMLSYKKSFAKEGAPYLGVYLELRY